MKKVEPEKEFDPFEDDEQRKTEKLEIEDEKKKAEKKTSKKILFKKPDKTEMVLAIVFVILLIITICLGLEVQAIKKQNINKVKSSIVISVLGKDTNNEISVDVSKMKKGDTKDYAFNISNFKDESINKEEVPYAIQIVSEDGFDIELYKNDSNENILPENRILIENKLIGNEKQKDKYTLKIKANKKTKDKELIAIRVIS